MRIIAALIALAGIAGLVALIAPVDGASILPFLLEHDTLRGILLLAAFALGLGLGAFAFTKERMSRLHSICTLVGFAAAAFVIEIWRFIERMTQGLNMPGSGAIMTGAIVLGVIASIAAIVKGRANY